MGVLTKLGSKLVKSGSELIGRRGAKDMGMVDEVVPLRLGKKASGEVAEASSKAAKDEGGELAKRGSEVIGRRPTKDMGMVDEVTPPKLSSSKSVDKAVDKSKVGKAAGAAGIAGVAALAAMSDNEAPAKPKSSSKSSEASYSNESRRSSESSSDKEDAAPKTFGAAFKAARADGKSTFTYEGKKYTTETKEEASAKSSKKSDTSTSVREGRNENIDDETRQRAMKSVEGFAKGGVVTNKGIGASMSAHNVFANKFKKK